MDKSWKFIGLGFVFISLVTASSFIAYIFNQQKLSRGRRESLLKSEAYSPSILGNFSVAGVAIDGEPCAKIAKDVMMEGGTGVDAAIAGMFCNGVYSSQSMGIGGGFMMTVFDAESGKTFSLDAREAAPRAATPDMYSGDKDSARYGPLSVAVPGEIAGYWAAKQRFGNKSISWMRLVEPTVKMCKEGIRVSWTAGQKLRLNNTQFTQEKIKSVFHDPSTGEPWLEGDIYTRPDLAETLLKLAEAGDNGEENLGFYSGKIGEDFVSDLQELGGILTMDDMRDYKVHWSSPVSVHLNSINATLFSNPPPASGALMAYILNILDNFDIKENDVDDLPLLYHRMTEAFKWAFARRTLLGDPQGDESIADIVNNLVKNITSEWQAEMTSRNIKDNRTEQDPLKYGAEYYSSDDHGTAHVSILAPNGDAVSATSTINLYYGSLLMSEKTGILYNDEMDDFSAPNIINYFGVPPSPNNFIKGGKRPLSSMCPSLLVGDDGNVRLVIGAAGGTKITTSLVIALINNQWLKKNIKDSIDTRRIHHQLMPMKVSFENLADESILEGLRLRGHQLVEQDGFGSVVVGVERREDGRIYANTDFRKAGAVDGF